MRIFIFSVISLLYFITLNAQNDVFTNEITRQDDKILYNGKPLTGWLYSSEDGIPNSCDCTLKAKYAEGVLNGSKKEWYKNGKIKFSGSFINGEKNNSHRYYYKNGKIRKEETYQNDVLVSSKLYNTDGSQKGVSPQKKTTTSKKKPTKPLSHSDTLEITKPTINPNSSFINSDGLHRSYFTDGKTKRVSLYQNGLLVKDSIFNQNGHIQFAKKYSDGELIRNEIYNNKGRVIEEQNFNNNKKDGFQIKKFDNEQPKSIENYQNGMLAHRIEYTKEGLLIKEENYTFNKKNGEQKEYDSKGQLTLLDEYRMGILLKTEIYNSEGKKVTLFNNKLAEIKVYNKSHKLLNLQYKNLKTNQKDSLWIDYNPNNGFKISEIAYKDGKIIRKGSYLNNQKEGDWHHYALDGTAETLISYSKGKEVAKETLTYAKQIKNNLKNSDLVFGYINISKPVDKQNEYILVRFKDAETDREQRIQQKIKSTFNQNFNPINNTTSIEEEELHSIFDFTSIKYQQIPKKVKSKKHVFHIQVYYTIKNVEKDEFFEKTIRVTPVTKKNPKIQKLYTKDIEKAFKTTLNNVSKSLSKVAQERYPLKGVIKKIKNQNKKEIKEVIIDVKTKIPLQEKDLFDVLDSFKNIRATLKITSIKEGIYRCDVVEGGNWLKKYLNENPKPIIHKKN